MDDFKGLGGNDEDIWKAHKQAYLQQRLYLYHSICQVCILVSVANDLRLRIFMKRRASSIK
jgi:hypothetical protein